MPWLTRLLNNRGLILANRIAPVASCLILSVYALSGTKIRALDEPSNQQSTISNYRENNAIYHQNTAI